MYVYTCAACSHTGAPLPPPNLRITKIVFQGEDDLFDKQHQILQKKMELLGHHLTGSQAAKKRFEAMLA